MHKVIIGERLQNAVEELHELSMPKQQMIAQVAKCISMTLNIQLS
jgi:hypothetical protein